MRKSSDGGLIALQGLHAGTNIALDIDQRPMPRGPMFPRWVFFCMVGSVRRLMVIQAAAAAYATHGSGRYHSDWAATACDSQTCMIVLSFRYSSRTHTGQSHYCTYTLCCILYPPQAGWNNKSVICISHGFCCIPRSVFAFAIVASNEPLRYLVSVPSSIFFLDFLLLLSGSSSRRKPLPKRYPLPIYAPTLSPKFAIAQP